MTNYENQTDKWNTIIEPKGTISGIDKHTRKGIGETHYDVECGRFFGTLEEAKKHILTCKEGCR